MEPTPEEFRGFQTVGELCTWVGLPGDAHEPSTARGVFLESLGCDADTHWRTLAAMPLLDFEAAVDSCLTADEQGSEARLTPAEKSQAGLVGRCARVCGGLELSIAAQNAQRASDEAHGRAVEMARASTLATSVAAPTTTVAVPAVSKAAPTGRTVPMKDVIDIARSDEPPVMPQSEHMAFHATYKKWMHRAPPWDSEPTIEQISAVQVLVKEHVPPYVDLFIFGPHGQRTLRNLELRGLSPW